MGEEALAAYRFSSLPVYADRRSAPEWLTTPMLAAPFASGADYLEFVLDRHATDMQFSGVRPPLHPIDVDRLDQAIASVAQIDVCDLYQPTPGKRNDARALAAVLATELRVCNGLDFERYGDDSSQAFRNASSRGRERVRRDSTFDRFRQRVMAALVQ